MKQLRIVGRFLSRYLTRKLERPHCFIVRLARTTYQQIYSFIFETTFVDLGVLGFALALYALVLAAALGLLIVILFPPTETALYIVDTYIWANFMRVVGCTLGIWIFATAREISRGLGILGRWIAKKARAVAADARQDYTAAVQAEEEAQVLPVPEGRQETTATLLEPSKAPIEEATILLRPR